MVIAGCSHGLWRSFYRDHPLEKFENSIRYGIVETVLKEAGLFNFNVLDVGGGSGAFFRYMLCDIGDYHLVDLNKKNIKLFNEWGEDTPRITVNNCNFNDLELKEEYNLILFLGWAKTFNREKIRDAFENNCNGFIIFESAEKEDFEKIIGQPCYKKIKYFVDNTKYERRIYVFKKGE